MCTVQVSSLLSTQSDEMGMLEDFAYAMHALEHFRIGFEEIQRVDGAAAEDRAEPTQTEGFKFEVLRFEDKNSIVLGVHAGQALSSRLLDAFPVGGWLSLVPVLFSVGVNEMQTVAGVIGDVSLEKEINSLGIQRLTR